MANAHILVIDDEPDIRMLVQEVLQDEHYRVTTATGGESARAWLEHHRPDLILLDIWMPDVDGITLLRELCATGSQHGLRPPLICPVVVMSGHGTVETAVEATRLGAYDFLEKPLSLAKLLLTVARALEADSLRRENQGLKQLGTRPSAPLGRSELMQNLRSKAQAIAKHDAWVLLTGEPGVGKSSFARYIHDNSLRSQGPFSEVRVASIARENSERELFGSEDHGRVTPGRLEQASGGSLYLDDIADMDLDTQGRLMSALDSGHFLRVGGVRAVHVDVRVIAATSASLPERVHAGLFRENLYYRLSVLPIAVPSLREHLEDVPELLSHFVDVYIANDNLPYRRFSLAAQNSLRHYPWPGNILELSNLVHRAMILSTREEIAPQDLEAIRAGAGAALGSGQGGGAPQTRDSWLALPLREARERFERYYMEKNLAAVDGSVGRLAKIVGMERTNLYRKLKSLGIEIK